MYHDRFRLLKHFQMIYNKIWIGLMLGKHNAINIRVDHYLWTSKNGKFKIWCSVHGLGIHRAHWYPDIVLWCRAPPWSQVEKGLSWRMLRLPRSLLSTVLHFHHSFSCVWTLVLSSLFCAPRIEYRGVGWFCRRSTPDNVDMWLCIWHYFLVTSVRELSMMACKFSTFSESILPGWGLRILSIALQTGP